MTFRDDKSTSIQVTDDIFTSTISKGIDDWVTASLCMTVYGWTQSISAAFGAVWAHDTHVMDPWVTLHDMMEQDKEVDDILDYQLMTRLH